MKTATTKPAANLRADVTKTITDRVADPALWLLACARLCETLRLDPARSIPLGCTLEMTLAGLLSEAEKQGRSEAEVVRAMEAI